MSFLSSVLKSISKGDDSPSAPISRPPPAKSSVPNSIISGVKRKAETNLERPDSKQQKTDNNSLSNREIKPLPQRLNAGSTGATDTKSSAIAKSANPIIPGSIRTSKSASTPQESNSVSQNLKPNLLSRTGSGTGSLSRAKPTAEVKKVLGQPKPGGNGQAGGAGGSSTQAQPKKGSFKDLMARAKAAQTVAVGKITHKPVEKLSKKERLALAKGQLLKGKEGANSTTSKALPLNKSMPGKDGKLAKAAPPLPSSKYQGTSKPKPQAKSSYQGTAKPSIQPGYKGTSKSASSAKSTTRPSKKADRNEYLGTDEEDEGEYGYDYDSEDRYEENSDDFSDMDAGFDEIDHEEEEAERQAKKDDAKEQKLLERLAREKEDKKRGRF